MEQRELLSGEGTKLSEGVGGFTEQGDELAGLLSGGSRVVSMPYGPPLIP